MKSREDIEHLKQNWAGDPIWDIDDTEGFEEHRAELVEFRDKMKAEWTERAWRDEVLRFLNRNRVTASRVYHFKATHALPHVPEGHPFGPMHGHSYTLEVHVTGAINREGPERGMVLDFGKLDAVWSELRPKLEGSPLNELVSNPTVEEMAPWLWEHFHRVAWNDDQANFTRIILREDDNAGIFPPVDDTPRK
jgi:6-pyruvoyltetrahydropterin/6-carboxytetrahydropterin synthase